MEKEPEFSPITPDMADDWRQYILPALPDTYGPGFTFGRLLVKAQESSEQADAVPRGTISNAVMAMIMTGEVTVHDKYMYIRRNV